MRCFSLLLLLFFECSVFCSTSNKIINAKYAKEFSHYDTRSLLSNNFVNKNLGNEIIYQIVVDRFFNGNINNDCLYEGRFCVNQQYSSWQNWFRYHGGDLRGIIQKLSYLKDLGISIILLTPIFENQQVVVKTPVYGVDTEITSYHGYWIRDWFRLNPFFTDKGSTDYTILQELILIAKPQIKILLDTVFNHSNPVIATEESLNYLNAIEPIPAHPFYPRTHRGAIFEGGLYFTSHDEDVYRTITENAYISKFHHNPSNPQDLIQCDDWDDPWVVENCNLGGLTDINQDNPQIYDYFIRAHSFWLKYFNIAGFRLDTIKHVNHSFWSKFLSDIYKSNPNIISVGEYFDGGSLEPKSYKFYTTTSATMFDFSFRDALYSVFVKDEPFSKITKVWEQDSNLLDARYLVTFIDSHDLPRMRGDAKGAISYNRMKQAITLWLVSRGVPCIYYGLEQDLFVVPDKGDPFNRPMMQGFDVAHPFYVLIKKLNLLRKSNLSLRYGSTRVLYEDKDIVAFERVYQQDAVFFITSKKSSNFIDKFSFINLNFSDGYYKDILNDNVYYQIENKTLNISIQGGDTRVIATNYKK